jgi:hypothetical protein
LNGQSLTVAGVVGVARYGTSVALDDAPKTRERMAKSRSVLVGKVQAAKSVYGVSTGLGGSGTCSHSRAPITRPPDVTATIIIVFSHPIRVKIKIKIKINRPSTDLQRIRGQMIRSASGMPSCSITTRAYCRL